MIKQFLTLMRGTAHEAGQAAIDANAITLLNQEIRDSTQAIEKARYAVAVAIAQNEREERQHRSLCERIKDLETRTIAALEKDEQALAEEAAETIAILEDERTTSEQAQDVFKREIAILKARLRDAENRLRELQRGQRLVHAKEQTRKLNAMSPQADTGALTAAEETLARINNRQSETEATARALDAMKNDRDPANLSAKMADAGLGAPMKTRRDDVLARLQKKAKA